MTKRCGRCEVRKPVAAFSKDVRYRDGVTSYCKACYQAYGRARRYGLTTEQVEEMLAEQGGGCGSCRTPLNGAFHIDHCHTTTRVRSLLCRECNWALGMMGEDVARIRALADYAEAHQLSEKEAF